MTPNQKAYLKSMVFIQYQIEKANGRKTTPKECLKIVLDRLNQK